METFWKMALVRIKVQFVPDLTWNSDFTSPDKRLQWCQFLILTFCHWEDLDNFAFHVLCLKFPCLTRYYLRICEWVVYWNDHTVLDNDDDDDDNVKGQIVDFNAKLFPFRGGGGSKSCWKVAYLKVFPFQKYSSRNINRKISFLTRVSSLLDSKTACVAYKLCVR